MSEEKPIKPKKITDLFDALGKNKERRTLTEQARKKMPDPKQPFFVDLDGTVIETKQKHDQGKSTVAE